MPLRSNISFRSIGHSIKPGVEIVEVLLDGHVCAVIYPGLNGFRIVSAHMVMVEERSGEGEVPPIPSVEVSLDPRPFWIEDGKLKRGP